jgi:hypothetical protein
MFASAGLIVARGFGRSAASTVNLGIRCAAEKPGGRVAIHSLNGDAAAIWDIS